MLFIREEDDVIAPQDGSIPAVPSILHLGILYCRQTEVGMETSSEMIPP